MMPEPKHPDDFGYTEHGYRDWKREYDNPPVVTSAEAAREGGWELARRQTMTLEEQITQAAARGYCHPENSTKEVDADLLKAIVEEVVKSLIPEVNPGHGREADRHSYIT